MEFEGTVFSILPVVKGQGARGEWVKQEVVFELPGEFSRKACIAFWGDKAQDVASLKPGDQVTVHFNLESREHNGRWFTEARAWRIVRKGNETGAGYGAPQQPYSPPAYGAPAQSAGVAADMPPMPSKAEDIDDLPF